MTHTHDENGIKREVMVVKQSRGGGGLRLRLVGYCPFVPLPLSRNTQ